MVKEGSGEETGDNAAYINSRIRRFLGRAQTPIDHARTSAGTWDKLRSRAAAGFRRSDRHFLGTAKENVLMSASGKGNIALGAQLIPIVGG